MIITGPRGLVNAAIFYAKKLGIDGEDFTVDIRRVRNIPELGTCFFDEVEKVFELELNSRKDTIYRTLAHEFVHIKQYIRKELIDLDNGEVIWNGEKFQALNNDSYWDAPWEIEAYGKELGLVTRYTENKENN